MRRRRGVRRTLKHVTLSPSRIGDSDTLVPNGMRMVTPRPPSAGGRPLSGDDEIISYLGGVRPKRETIPGSHSGAPNCSP